MRGQVLIIRSAAAEELAAIRALAEPPLEVPEPGSGETCLVAKVIGELAGVISASVANERLELRTLYVMPRLRRKRIGRALLDALAREASERELREISAPADCAIAGYLARRGFVSAPPLLTRTAMGGMRR